MSLNKYKGVVSTKRIMIYVIAWEVSRKYGSIFLMTNLKWYKWKFKQHKERSKGLKHRR